MTAIAVTARHSRILAGMSTRNGPELTCSACDRTIPVTMTVVIATSWQTEQRAFAGISYEGLGARGRAELCQTCWDTAAADTAGPVRHGYAGWRRIGDRQYRIGRQPGEWPCAWCARPVLADISRRKFASCSKRCQVYVSQEHHGTTRSRSRDRATGIWRVPDSRDCAVCGHAFSPRERSHTFCSGACRQRAYRNRSKARAMTRTNRPATRRKS